MSAFTIRRAELGEVETVAALWQDAAARLAQLGTDQWQYPVRRDRIQAAIEAATCWLIEDDHRNPVGTVTLDGWADPQLWQPDDEPGAALYVHRLVLADEVRGSELGSAVLDWASRTAQAQGRRWLRLDAWTTNDALHRYYLQHAFRHIRTIDHDDIVSGALFERDSSTALGRGPSLHSFDDASSTDSASSVRYVIQVALFILIVLGPLSSTRIGFIAAYISGFVFLAWWIVMAATGLVLMSKEPPTRPWGEASLITQWASFGPRTFLAGLIFLAGAIMGSVADALGNVTNDAEGKEVFHSIFVTFGTFMFMAFIYWLFLLGWAFQVIAWRYRKRTLGQATWTLLEQIERSRTGRTLGLHEPDEFRLSTFGLLLMLIGTIAWLLGGRN